MESNQQKVQSKISLSARTILLQVYLLFKILCQYHGISTIKYTGVNYKQDWLWCHVIEIEFKGTLHIFC